MYSTSLKKISLFALLFTLQSNADWSIQNSTTGAIYQKFGSSQSWLPMISTLQKDRFTNESKGTISVSFDQGFTWAESFAVSGDVEMTSAVGTAAGNYFVTGIRKSDETVVYASYNSARSFEQVDLTVCTRNSNSLFGTLKVTKKDELVLAGMCNFDLIIKISKDQGKTWKLVSKFTPGPGLYRFVNQSFDLGTNDEVYILDGNGNTFKYPLNDPNASWTLFSASSQVSLTQKVQSVLPAGILVDHTDSVYLFGRYYFPLSTDVNFLKYTHDLGVSWKTVNLGELNKPLTKAGFVLGVTAMERTTFGKLYMAVTAKKTNPTQPEKTESKGLVFVSADGGQTWSQDTEFDKLGVDAVTDIHLNADQVVYVNGYRLDKNNVYTALTIKQNL